MIVDRLPTSQAQFAWLTIGDVGVGPVLLDASSFAHLQPLLRSLHALIGRAKDDVTDVQLHLHVAEAVNSRGVCIWIAAGGGHEGPVHLSEREADDLAAVLEAITECLIAAEGPGRGRTRSN